MITALQTVWEDAKLTLEQRTSRINGSLNTNHSDSELAAKYSELIKQDRAQILLHPQEKTGGDHFNKVRLYHSIISSFMVLNNCCCIAHPATHHPPIWETQALLSNLLARRK